MRQYLVGDKLFTERHIRMVKALSARGKTCLEISRLYKVSGVAIWFLTHGRESAYECDEEYNIIWKKDLPPPEDYRAMKKRVRAERRAIDARRLAQSHAS